MAHLRVLGIQRPSALNYCISEGLLTETARSDSYQWTTSPTVPHEELLVTNTAVVWSQAGVIRRVFRFEVEKEPVIQALFTWFPSDGNERLIPDLKSKKHGAVGNVDNDEPSTSAKSKSKSYANQLGTVPSVKSGPGAKFKATKYGEAAAEGYTTAETNETQGGQKRALVIFLRSQAQIFFLSGTHHVIHLPFEIRYALAAPQGVMIQRIPPPAAMLATGKDVPRLFSLTDPLMEVGLVVTQETGSALTSSEEIIYISDPEPPSSRRSHEPSVIFVVTRDVARQNITVWQAKYIPQESLSSSISQKRTPSASGAASRRRSSFGAGTGATTPIPPNVSVVSVPDEALSFDNFDGERTNKRRVSSMVARSDLSGPMDRRAFNDTSTSSSFYQPPIDDLLEDLNNGLGFGSMGLYDGEGLRNEMLMTRIETFNMQFPMGDQDALPRVFSMRAPPVSNRSVAESNREVLVIVNRAESKVLQLTIQLPTQPTGAVGPFSRKRSAKYASLKEVVKYAALDAIKLSDGNINRLVLLEPDGKISLVAPWASVRTGLQIPKQRTSNSTYMLGVPYARNNISEFPMYDQLEFSQDGGRFSVVDTDGALHRLSVRLSPRNTAVQQALETVKYVLPAERNGEVIHMVWMEVMRMLSAKLPPSHTSTNFEERDADEWTAFVVSILLLGAVCLPPKAPKSKKRGLNRISTGSSESWNALLRREYDIGPQAEYLRGSTWEWLGEVEEELDEANSAPVIQLSTLLSSSRTKKNSYIVDCLARAREFSTSPAAAVFDGEIPTAHVNPEIRRTSLPMLLVALHILREEWKLDVGMDAMSRKMIPVLLQIAVWLGWQGWVEHYLDEDIEVECWEVDDSRLTGPQVPEPEDFQQPSIYDWLINSLEEADDIEPFMTLHDIISPKEKTASTTNPYFHQITPRTAVITEIYRMIRDPEKPYEDIVACLVENNITASFIESYPEGVAVPIWESIARCQDIPPTTWGEPALDLVGRKDLKMLITEDGKREPIKWSAAPVHEAVRDVHGICSGLTEPEQPAAFDGSTEQDRSHVTRLIFKEDRRVIEAHKLLQSTRPQAVKFLESPGMTDQEGLDAQQQLAQLVALRTLAVPVGRALIFFNARMPLLTEKFPVPGFNLTCVMKPANFTIAAEKSSYTEEKVCWAFFHSGACAGLSIAREAKDIDTSYIVFNKPAELSNRHAGFLLALGLNGHLKHIAKWHAFNYLTPKHTMTSIGLLLGLSASYLGTMDMPVTKLLSVHVTRLLPQGSAELNLSPLTQTAGIMGIGLLYCNTQHRRMSEVLLSEIEHVGSRGDFSSIDKLRDEGYRLAAGFALGFINLGKGKELSGLHDMSLVERLLELAVGSKKVEVVHVLDKAAAGATVALALIYMKSEDETLAKKVDIPDTFQVFDFVRPDIFIMRTFAKHLIMWSKIDCSMAWIRKNIRPFLRSKWKLDRISSLDSSQLPLCCVIAGLCFAMSMKFAGTGNLEARNTLVHYLDQFIRLCSAPVMNHDQKLARACARNCQDLIALSAATVMAGTGDIIIFRRLRKLHGQVDREITYGSHMASHLALGVLFLGGGTYTFNTSNLAIASLLCAFYPLYPKTILDNKSHLQAFRHFWVLAAEPRCLVPRDVETFRPASVPVIITMKDGRTIEKTAPCVVPELDQMASVRTAGTQYWSSALDFAQNLEHVATFKRTQTVYVQLKPPHAATKFIYQSTLVDLQRKNEDRSPMSGFEWLLRLRPFSQLDNTERSLLLPPDVGMPMNATVDQKAVDWKMMLEKASLSGMNADRLRNVKLLFAFVDLMDSEGLLCLTAESVDRLRAALWTAFS